MNDITKMTVNDLISRQKLLESEVDANEDEIRILLEELNRIYTEIDKRKGNKNAI